MKRAVAVAPSSAWDPARLARGVAKARELGIDVDVTATLAPDLWRSATPEVRIAELLAATSRDDIDGVWLVRGGEGLLGLLGDLPLGALGRRPILGFSDATALAAGIWAAGAATPFVHGPVLHALPDADDATCEAVAAWWAGRPAAPLRGRVVVPGRAEGPLVGGNLHILASLCGTPWQLNANGSILVLEDVGEPAYRLGRAIAQLRAAGGFDGVRAIALGTFHDCRGGADYSAEDAVLRLLAPLGCPILADLPIGHGAANVPWRFGATARLDADALTLDAAPVG